MPAANINKIIPRVLWIMGSHNGGFNTTVSDDRFILEEVQRAIVTTESNLVKAICQYGHPLRKLYELTAVVSNESTLPKRLGEIIKVSSIASDSTEKDAEFTSRTNILLWRENPNNMYDTLPHTDKNSILFGYYNITGEIVYFTGVNAKIYYSDYTPDFTTYNLTLPDYMEDALVSGTITMLMKLGVPEDVLMTHSSIFNSIVNDIKNVGPAKVDEITEQKQIMN